jgi:predicted DNA-binding WGR domain protein
MNPKSHRLVVRWGRRALTPQSMDHEFENQRDKGTPTTDFNATNSLLI